MKKRTKIILSVIAIIISLGIVSGVLLWNGIILLNNPSIKQYPVKGIDVSSYQGEINWQTLSSQNIQFAFIKATEGSSYKDPCFDFNFSEAQKTNLRIGAYHFFSYDSSGETQAENFISTVPKIKGMLPPVVDLEFYGDKEKHLPDKKSTQTELNILLNKLEKHYGLRPILYVTEKSYKLYIAGNYQEYDIWIRNVITRPSLSNNRAWTFWQYTNREKLEGYNGKEKYIDMNIFKGTQDEFDKYANDIDANYSILPYNSGRDKVLFKFKDESYHSIDEYPRLKQFCSKEIAEVKDDASISIDVAKCNLNDDGKTDYVIRISSAMLYGNSGSMYKFIISLKDNTLKEINFGLEKSNLAIMKSKTNGLYDISFSGCFFHALLKYDGKNSYHFESPTPLWISRLQASPNNWKVENGKLYLYYDNVMFAGNEPPKENLPFYVGIKIDSLVPYLNSSILWAHKENGELLSFHSITEPTESITFVFVADIGSDESKIADILKNGYKDGYVFPDDAVFAY